MAFPGLNLDWLTTGTAASIVIYQFVGKCGVAKPEPKLIDKCKIGKYGLGSPWPPFGRILTPVIDTRGMGSLE